MIEPTGAPPSGRRLATLSLAALGVVYGDIGTSPIYALRECFNGPHAVAISPQNVLGVLSLVCWSLILVVSVKYLAYVLRADHHGEGGILSLMALAFPKLPANDGRTGMRKRSMALVVLGLFGAALLYGDGIITPAISVLSAMEGVELVAPKLHTYIVPATVAILIALFWVQHRGTRGVGKVFGPITLLWFFTIGTIGVYQIVRWPDVLRAFDPRYAVAFFGDHGWAGFLVLSAVALVVTGCESLYADLGHFGKRPIRLTWFTLVLPALLLNYIGQGALLLHTTKPVPQPFFEAAPSWALIPLIVLSTAATVIASQAVISSAFSLSRQAVMLGYLPRLRIEHTSAHEIGQIYVPSVNWALMIACIALVVGFQSSSGLAAAYGIAVTSTMAITTIMAFQVARYRWKWPLPIVIVVTVLFLIADVTFLSANLFKIQDGGWVPLVVAAGILLLMLTWKRGRAILSQRVALKTVPLAQFMGNIRNDPDEKFCSRVPGISVYMSSTPDVAPLALMYNVKYNHVVHDFTVILTVRTDDMPYVPEAERVWLEPLGQGFWRLTGVFGFMEDPDVAKLLAQAHSLDPSFHVDLHKATFFLGHETILSVPGPGMARWRERLFGVMARNAANATHFFNLPADRVVELGAHIEI